MPRGRRRVAFEETAWDILRYLENSEDLKVSVTEFLAITAGNVGRSMYLHQRSYPAGKKRERTFFFEIFRQGGEEVCIASWARWIAQLQGLVELEKRCQNTRQEVNYLSERRETFRGMVEDKIRMQSRATENYFDQIFEEMKELQERNQTRLCYLCRKSSIYGDIRTKEMKQEDCRDLEAREG